MPISDESLEKKLGELLDDFHARRLVALQNFKLNKLLGKNPYLYRSMGIAVASDYVRVALDAFVSSSDETIFGNVFFEPLAIWAAKATCAGTNVSVQTGGGAGFDLALEGEREFRAIAVKSGKNIFNVQSNKQQNTEFAALEARLRKDKKALHKIVGYAYGRKSPASKDGSVIKIAGQAFWQEITGETDFYKRIILLLGRRADPLRTEFEKAYSEKRGSLEKAFHSEYTDAGGQIDWEKLIAYNSAIAKPKAAKKATSASTKK